jgi:hypothetical protein
MALTQLYPILIAAITITVAVGGASVGAISVPVAALDADIPAGTILDFGASKFAKVVSDASAGDTALDTDPIPTALIAGDTATYAPKVGSPLLSERWGKLATDAERTAQHIRAEMDLGLRAPVYIGTDAEELTYAIVLQINTNLERGATPVLTKGTANAKSGANETYRDRWVNPEAAAIVARVTGVQAVRFVPVTAGV